MTSRTPAPDDRHLPARERWDQRYRDWRDRFTVDQPHALVLREAERIPRVGPALDLAAGLGRNALWLAARGLAVTAVDISGVACDHLRAAAAGRLLAITVVCADLEAAPLPSGPFGLIVNTLYLQRDLAPAITAALAPGGLLLFAALLDPAAAPGHPPRHYALPGELPALFPALDVLAYDEVSGDGRPEAWLVARRPPAQGLGGGSSSNCT